MWKIRILGGDTIEICVRVNKIEKEKARLDVCVFGGYVYAWYLLLSVGWK